MAMCQYNGWQTWATTIWSDMGVHVGANEYRLPKDAGCPNNLLAVSAKTCDGSQQSGPLNEGGHWHSYSVSVHISIGHD